MHTVQVWSGVSHRFSSRVRADALEYRDQVNRLAIRRTTSRHRPARNKNRRDIDTHCSVQHTRHDFVAIRHAHHAIELVRLQHGLHAVGDQFPRWQRKFHTRMSHSDSIIYTDGVEFKWNPASGAYSRLSRSFQIPANEHARG